jgi:molybdate transport system ATP-binding protein
MADARRMVATLRHELPGFLLDVELDIALDGVTGLFGPSGAGKSTLLRAIAGFERQATGRLQVGDAVWQDDRSFVPPHRRPVGFVFQDARLFPHLSVRGNLGYALDRAAGEAAVIRFDEVVEALDLEPLLDRSVDRLSGGEQQRVAIGRTLLTRPELLLFDEPMAALDAKRKREILPYLEALPARFGIPAIYVSHATGEMARLADQVVVIESGRIAVTGPAAAILSQADLQAYGPGYEPVTLLDAVVASPDAGLGLTEVSYEGQRLLVPNIPDADPGDTVRLSIRAGDVVIATSEPAGISVRSVLSGRIAGIDPIADSAFALVTVDIGDTLLAARLTQHAIDAMDLTVGRAVFALIKAAAFDRNL